MDIYRYPPYQYGQSDELSKQMFAQQALSSGLPYQRPGTSHEPHSMPIPSGAPWNIQGVSWGLPSPPQLVQFTGQPQLEAKPSHAILHCKRKSLDVEPVIPAKQLITEEKMAAHLSGLHISSDYTAHSLATLTDENMDLGMDGAMTLSEKLKGHKIVLSEELKKLQEEPLIPATLMERLEKPHMSLVVWKPRDNILEKIKEVEEKPHEEEKKRPGVLVSEISPMEMEMS
ncbi:PREDICTED: uncharacterized protein LOC106117634 isoform X2 [Papilio xuthus]|uniref:Uncharacterized protein LOC106117634 isoform X2 n=1 Tax=Papilio xuthus TaxID=66420 RepID=A0A0N0P9D9_PAPXU|nr:PREDICTED: uncharacterized protein LOC106117634 isoform X2 [Papilio xuthus]KPJ00069.1 hypothetical protein RR46_00768 [Papilio xuthus]